MEIGLVGVFWTGATIGLLTDLLGVFALALICVTAAIDALEPGTELIILAGVLSGVVRLSVFFIAATVTFCTLPIVLSGRSCLLPVLIHGELFAWAPILKDERERRRIRAVRDEKNNGGYGCAERCGQKPSADGSR